MNLTKRWRWTFSSQWVMGTIKTKAHAVSQSTSLKMERENARSMAREGHLHCQSKSLISKDLATFWSTCLEAVRSTWVLLSILLCPMDLLMSMTRFTVMTRGETSIFRQFKLSAVFFSIMTQTKKFHVMDLALEFLLLIVRPIVSR